MQAQNREEVVATIADGEAISGGVYCEGGVIVGIHMPAVWDAAVITFQVSMDNADYLDSYSAAGAEHTITVAADQHIWLDPSQFASYRWVKVRSGTTATPVNQVTGADDKLVTLIVRGIN